MDSRWIAVRLQRCFALLEDLPARELAKRGWVCNHGLVPHQAKPGDLRERARARQEKVCRVPRLARQNCNEFHFTLDSPLGSYDTHPMEMRVGKPHGARKDSGL